MLLPRPFPAAAWSIDGDNRRQITTEWDLLTELAATQGGIVGREQLEALGIEEWRIDNWLKARRLHVWYRGVYAVGHRAVGALGRRKAAQLAGGERAALCCQTGSDFLGVRPYSNAAVHIWVPGQRGRTIDGIVAHRFADMVETDIEVVEGVRTTNAMRVLVDMAHAWTEDQIVRAFDRTEELRLFDLRSLEELMARRPARPGTPKLRLVREMYEEPAPSLTELEKRGLQMIRKAGLPKPKAQWHTTEGRVDFYFPEAAMILEMDSFRWHRDRSRFEGDRSRDLEHMAQGMATARVTWHQALQAPTIDRIRRIYRNRVVS